MTNLFADLPRQLPDELLTLLLQTGDVRIERILHGARDIPALFDI